MKIPRYDIKKRDCIRVKCHLITVGYYKIARECIVTWKWSYGNIQLAFQRQWVLFYFPPRRQHCTSVQNIIDVSKGGILFYFFFAFRLILTIFPLPSSNKRSFQRSTANIHIGSRRHSACILMSVRASEHFRLAVSTVQHIRPPHPPPPASKLYLICARRYNVWLNPAWFAWKPREAGSFN